MYANGYMKKVFYTFKYLTDGFFGLFGESRPPCFDKLVQWTKGLVTGVDYNYFKDELGTTGVPDGRPDVVGSYLEGNASRYGKVYKSNGAEFTDANLPTNWQAEWDGFYNSDQSLNFGLFGFDTSGADEFNCFTRSGNDRVRVEMYGITLETAPTGLVIGDTMNVKVKVTGSVAELIFNDGIPISDTFTLLLSNKQLEILTRGETASPSNHECNYFKITNTDTDEVIMDFNFEENNNASRIVDKSGNDYYALIENGTGADRVTTNRVNSDFNQEGGTYVTPLTPIKEDGETISDVEVIVDGVEDYNTDNYTILDAGAIVVDGAIQITADGVGFVNARYEIDLKPSTEYTIVWDILENTNISDPLGFVSVRTVGFATPLLYFPNGATGEVRQKFTTVSSITDPYIWSYARSVATAGEVIKARFKIYLGDFTTGDLPASGEAVIGNSKIGRVWYDTALTTQVEEGVNLPKLNNTESVGWLPTNINDREYIEGAYLEGDGSRRVEVVKPDGSDFTDADLPTNYSFFFTFIVQSFSSGKVFGFRLTGADEYWVGAQSNELRAEIGGTGIQSTASLSTGTVLTGEIRKSGTTYELYVNGGLEDSATITPSLSNNQLQFLTRGEGSEPSTIQLINFMLTNTDTDETILDFNFEEGNEDNVCIDRSGNGHIGEIQNPTGDDRVRDNTIDSDANDFGYTVSRALGKNLLDEVNYIEGFISQADGSLIPSPVNRTSQQILITDSRDFVISSNSNRAVWRSLDKDGNILDFTPFPLLNYTAPSGTKFVQCYYMAEAAGITTENQIEEGSTATAYEAYEGFYYDTLQANPVPQGKTIPITAEGKTSVYDSNGVQIDSQYTGSWFEDNVRRPKNSFKGAISADIRVFDGIEDYNTDNYSFLDTGAVIADGMLEITADGVNFVDAKYDIDLDTSTLYTIVWEIETNTLEIPFVNALVRQNDFCEDVIAIPIGVTGEFRDSFTTLATIVNPFIWTFVSPSETVGKGFKGSFKIYLGDRTTGDLESGQDVSGNSLINLTTKYELVEAYSGNTGSFTANGSDNYLDTGIIPNQNTIMKVWGKFNDLSGGQYFGQNSDSLGDYYWGLNSPSTLRLDFGLSSYIGYTADTELHLYEVNDGELLIDGEFALGVKGVSILNPSNSIYLLDQNGNFSGQYANFTMYKAEIIHNGSTYIWDFNIDGDETVKYTIDDVLQASPTIQGALTSSQWDTRREIIPCNTELETKWFNTCDLNNVQPLPVAISELLNVDGNQVFINKDEDPIQEFTVSVTSGANGTATVNGASSVTGEIGTPLTFVATPDSGYELDAWTPATTATIEGDATHNATFKLISNDPPEYVASATAVSNSTDTLVVDVPVGTVDGDVMLALAYSNDLGSTITPPAGWTLIDTNSTTWTAEGEIYYKVASSEPANYSWGFPPANRCRVVQTTFRNIDETTPVNQNSQSSATSGNPLNHPSITPSVDNCMLVATGTMDSTNSSVWNVIGLTNEAINTAGTASTVISYELQVTAGATGTVTLDQTASGTMGGFLLALNPK